MLQPLVHLGHKSIILLFSLFAKLTLVIMGWELLTDDIFYRLNQYNRTVLVFSHTSYVDFYILTLYLFAYPCLISNIRTLVKPQPFVYAGWILRRFGAIPATAVDDKQGGAVERITNELKAQERWNFLISPKGSILRRPWRSGYYVIAKELGAYLRVIGADYEKKKIVISDEIFSDKDESVIKNKLETELKEIVPLFPEEEIVPIRNHDEKNRSVVSPRRIGVIVCGLSVITALFL